MSIGVLSTSKDNYRTRPLNGVFWLWTIEKKTS
ncbi:hypothetical protein FLJU110815_12035 [Flavobacterium jumunjinense]